MLLSLKREGQVIIDYICMWQKKSQIIIDFINHLLVYCWIVYSESKITVINVQVSGLRTDKIPDVNISGMNQYEAKIKNNSLATLTLEEKSAGYRVGTDTHADTSCAGKHVRVLEIIDGKSYTIPRRV